VNASANLAARLLGTGLLWRFPIRADARIDNSCLQQVEKLKSVPRKVNNFNLDARILLVALLSFGVIA